MDPLVKAAILSNLSALKVILSQPHALPVSVTRLKKALQHACLFGRGAHAPECIKLIACHAPTELVLDVYDKLCHTRVRSVDVDAEACYQAIEEHIFHRRVPHRTSRCKPMTASKDLTSAEVTQHFQATLEMIAWFAKPTMQ
jgi:hypothetical protein